MQFENVIQLMNKCGHNGGTFIVAYRHVRAVARCFLA